MIFVELEALESSSASNQLVRELALVVGVRIVVSSALLVDLLVGLFSIIWYTPRVSVSYPKVKRAGDDAKQH